MIPFTKMPFRNLAKSLAFLAGLSGLSVATTASAATYYYVDWQQANLGLGTASGVITLPDLSQVTVSFAATNPNGTHGSLFGAQLGNVNDINFWNPTTPYISNQVSNAPTGTDLLQLSGGQGQIYTVTLSAAIKDPIMAILSLGQPNVTTTYDFNSPFTIVSQGTGFFGGTSSSLTQLPGDILSGREGHGTIQFNGTFNSFSWTVPTPETWHGFTFGIRTTEAIEPTNAPDQSFTVALLGLSLTGLALFRRRK